LKQAQEERVDKDLVEDVLRTLGARVLRVALNLLSVALLVMGIFVLVTEARSHTLNATSIALSCCSLVFILLRALSSRLGFVTSAFAFLVLLAVTAFLVETRGGIAVGSVSLNMLVPLLCALFFGRRGAVLGLITMVALFAVAGCLVVYGVVPPISKELWDANSATFWIRQTIALALFGATIVMSALYIVERLAQEARRLQSQAEREHRQRLALERSESEREHERGQRLEAQKALEESRRIEALARLAGGIAHDFNNGLTVILSSAELLKRNSGSPAAVEARADEIVEAATRAATLTLQLLTLGRRQATKPESVRVAEMLARVSAAFRRLLPSDVALSVESPDETVTVRVDPAELERALFNLVLNARDAMPSGGKLSIECRRKSAAESKLEAASTTPAVVITVSDTGVGMDAETMAHIFDPFFTTKSPGMGTGLGLATVYAFAKESQGDVRVNSTVGAGATFQLILPEDVHPPSAIAGARADATTSAIVREHSTVLVVEDRDDVRASMVTILRRGGFEVSEAADGDKALAVLATRNDFVLMLIDGVMPGAATGAVIERAEELAPSMRILLCSGYLQEDLLRRNVAAGSYAFLQKPFTASELLASVRELIAKPKSAVGRARS
jgi:signal transduction histidine kinase/CheY-like chemotaxis protein